MAEKQVFEAIMNKDDKVDGTNVIIPYDVEAVHHAKRVKVKATFDGVPYQGSIVRMDGDFVIGIPKVIREQTGKKPGEVLLVTIEEDHSERKAEVPEPLEKAFSEQPSAKTFFDSLSYTNQRKYTLWIDGSKKEETRSARVQKTVEMLLEGKKL